MENIVDLHGLTENDAIMAITAALLAFDLGDIESIEFITGRGDVLRRVLEECLESENMAYYHRNGNHGSYIVPRPL